MEVGKRVETRTENVNVDLTHEEVVIERHPVSSPRPVEGNVTLGASSQTIRVDLEAERASVQKQAYVTQEVEIGKRSETEQRTFSDTIGKEVLEVTKTGDVEMSGDAVTGNAATGKDDRTLLERGSDAVKNAADPLDGKIDRDELGISQIYIQAKRYAEDVVVGRPTVQSFVGALATRGATVGVLFTTSRFTAEATDAAQRVPQDIALVDGLKLTELMIKHRVGVQVARRIEIVKIDEDFFSEE